jgi:peptide deformylase
MPKSIVQQENKVLRAKAKPVPAEIFGTTELKKIIADMSASLATCDDGIALAAPQIGISYRIFVVSGKLWTTEGEKLKPDVVFINPKITKKSKKVVTMDEGCLSVRWLYGKTRRAEKASVEAQDIDGKKITWHGSDLLAQIFQHEIDHLDGILFIDHATDLEEIKPENK